MQKVSIPKDRDGKQRTFGFVTFKHEISVPYVLELFQGTTLFDRLLTIKTRNNIEQPQLQFNNAINQSRYQDNFQVVQDYQNIYQLPDPRLINNIMPNLSMFDITFDQNLSNVLNNRLEERLGPQSRRNHVNGKSSHGGHPYTRDRDRDNKNDHRDRNDRRDRHSSHRSYDHHRDSNHRSSNRKNYRQT